LVTYASTSERLDVHSETVAYTDAHEWMSDYVHYDVPMDWVALRPDRAESIYVEGTGSQQSLNVTLPIIFDPALSSGTSFIVFEAKTAESDEPPTSTSPGDVLLDEEPVADEVSRLFTVAEGEPFEDGVESEFAAELMRLVEAHGETAMAAITSAAHTADPEVAAEAVRWLSRMDHPPTYLERRWLVESALASEHPIVRDAALIGLSFLNDPHALVYLRRASVRESIAMLKEDMLQLIRDLEAVDAKAS
jgi:hypothetical protein